MLVLSLSDVSAIRYGPREAEMEEVVEGWISHLAKTQSQFTRFIWKLLASAPCYSVIFVEIFFKEHSRKIATWHRYPVEKPVIRLLESIWVFQQDWSWDRQGDAVEGICCDYQQDYSHAAAYGRKWYLDSTKREWQTTGDELVHSVVYYRSDL